MANGKSSDPDDYVLRSGVRSGLKREFAFALKSQADLPKSQGRTRSGKVAAPSDPPPRVRKRSKKSDASEEQKTTSRPPLYAEVLPTSQEWTAVGVSSAAPSIGVTEEVSVADTREEPSPKSDVNAPVLSDNIEGLEKDGFNMDALPVVADCDDGLGENVMEEKSILMHERSIPKDKLDGSEKIPHPPFPPPLSPTLPLEPIPVVQELLTVKEENKDTSLLLENGSVADHPIVSKGSNTPKFGNGAAEKSIRRFTRSALKVMPVPAAPITIEHEENPVVVIPVSTTSLTVEQEEKLVEIPIIVDELGGLEFENGHLDWSIRAEIEGSVAVTIVTLKDEENDMDETHVASPLENPVLRLTKYLCQAATDALISANATKSTSGDSVESEDLKGDADTLNGSLSMTPKKKMELKMSKKITLTKLPSNVRDLLGTGLLEGLPVKYISCIGKNVGLHGVIRGNGILCSCTACLGTNVVSAYQFEIHAGSTKKHPSDFIFLENGKSLRDVLKSCTGASLDMLEAAIQNAIGPTPPKKVCVCQKCKEVFDTARIGKFALLCDSCLESSHRPAASTSPHGMTSLVKFPRKVFVPSASDGKPKNPSSQKKPSYGKLTKKDLGLHKLVFMDDILPQGTEVGYYVRGKRLLEGYIKDSGIFCSCCNSVVSPSQFEAHAGQASRRKPYNYIYTSNGVSLHELSVSLSKGRKFSPTENDDLCGICADGGNLLLCDLCPRAFHKECMGLVSVPNGNWFCQYCENMRQKERHLALNDNAIAAGRVAGVDPIEQIITRCIRIVTTAENDAGVCALCRQYDFSRSGFDQRTVIICDQCETEYHVGCLKDNDMADLKELPEGEWFCRPDCKRIHSALHDFLLQGPETLEEFDTDIIKKKLCEKGLCKDAAIDVRWRLLSGKNDSSDSKLLLSQAVTLFRDSFDPIVEPISGRDLIPFMVYCLNMRDQDFGGMYCMVLTVNSSVISAGLLRVLGCEVAELPIVATKKESRGLGFFQSLLSCIERLFKSLKVKHFVLPATGDAEYIWTKKFGFSKITQTQLREYAKGARPMSFQGTSMLHKPLIGQQEMVAAVDETSKMPS